MTNQQTTNSQTLIIIIPPEMEEERLDVCLNEFIENMSRSRIQKICKDGLIFVNGTVKKPGYQVKADDEIRVTIPEIQELNIEPENIPLDILYEDDDVLVVNKEKGMVVHPAAGHYSHTLVNALMYHCKDRLSGINGVMRPGIVHRIDRDTSGSLIVCKNDNAHRLIAEQLKSHSINRIYHAICIGNVKEDEGTIHAPIGRHPIERKKMAIVPNGKDAITHYKVLERFGNYTYMEFKLETGRTHQIRVHMASIHHPLLGDEVYGPGKSSFHTQGQVLHAKTLGFVHPVTGEYIETNAPLPDYFESILRKLRK